MRRILVAAGLIRGPAGGENADRILISRRPEGTHLALSWEFPGGKVEPGEAPAAALAREIAEEIGVDVEVGEIFAVGHHQYEAKEVVLLVYECRILAGVPQPLQVAELWWVTREQLLTVPLPPADEPVLERMRREAACAG
jgi:8-oxo-dGTP diphosphatase